MKYMLLIYVPEEATTNADPASIAGHVAMAAEATVRGAYVTCDALQPPSVATTVRVRDGETVISDGPFAETKEVLGGFYLLDCADLDEAIVYAAKIPPAAIGSVEVRPVQPMPEWDGMVRNAASKLTASMVH